MEEKGRFLQDLTTLLKLAQTNGQRITKQEIQDYFSEMELSANQWNLIYQYISSQGITIAGYEAAPPAVLEEEPLEDDPVEDAIISIYMDELKDKKELSPEQEQFVAKKMLTGDERAKNLLIESNLNLVAEIAREYRHKGLPSGDLIQEGNIGLLMGIGEYEPGYRVTFREYVTNTIRKAIEGALDKASRESMSARKVASRANELNDLAAEMAKELEREATPKELADRMGITENEVRELMKISLDAISVIEPGRQER